MNEQVQAALLERRVAALHAAGFPPSKIDERLGMEPGTAHDAMVEIWRRDKNARTRGER